MKYYADRRKAINMIDEMYEQGKTLEQMTFKIGKLFGFGQKLILDRIDIIEKMKNDQIQ